MNRLLHLQERFWRRFYAKPFWHFFDNEHERKFGGDHHFWGKRTRELFDHLATPDFCTLVADTFAMPELVMDPMGGGYHAIPPRGFLGIHHDFNRSAQGLYRRINLMCYLNDDWQDVGGKLEMWGYDNDKGDVVDVVPEFGTTVMFETSDHSWHGHPHPAERWRYSIAAYFFSKEPPPGYTHDHTTVWRDA